MDFILALHSHLPYVLHHGRWPHGSDWLCEAALDTYLPLLEREVVPLYYQRDERNIPLAWVERMKEALRVAGSRFTARRMVQEYVRDYYLPAMCGVLDGDDQPSA